MKPYSAPALFRLSRFTTLWSQKLVPQRGTARRQCTRQTGDRQPFAPTPTRWRSRRFASASPTSTTRRKSGAEVAKDGRPKTVPGGNGLVDGQGFLFALSSNRS